MQFPWRIRGGIRGRARDGQARSGTLTARGWALELAGALALLGGQVLGRRDLLYLGVFLLALPVMSALLLRWRRPSLAVDRRFRPETIAAGTATWVRLIVTPLRPVAGTVRMTEQLPARFGAAPVFRFPPAANPLTAEPAAAAPAAATVPAGNPGARGMYEYRLRAGHRGRYDVGPVTAELTDPFGLARRVHSFGEVTHLVVTPAPVELPSTALTGARGSDGTTVTRHQAHASDDDIMTREYRHGDPMRRVHWPATARHGTLMVRQEEALTTPQATIVLDRRARSFAAGLLREAPEAGGAAGAGSSEGMLFSRPAFELAITAVVSAAAHLIERNYAVRFLDADGAPGGRTSVTAPWPEDEEFVGAAGLQNLAEALAALGMTSDYRHSTGGAASGGTGTGGTASGGRGGGPASGGTDRGESVRRAALGAPEGVFGEPLLEKLAAHKLRGPLLALLGELSESAARALAPAAQFGSHAFALLIVDRPRAVGPALHILREAGWTAHAVRPTEPLAAAWQSFDEYRNTAAPVPHAAARPILPEGMP